MEDNLWKDLETSREETHGEREILQLHQAGKVNELAENQDESSTLVCRNDTLPHDEDTIISGREERSEVNQESENMI